MALLDEEFYDCLINTRGGESIHGAEVGPHQGGPEADGEVLACHQVDLAVVAHPARQRDAVSHTRLARPAHSHGQEPGPCCNRHKSALVRKWEAQRHAPRQRRAHGSPPAGHVGGSTPYTWKAGPYSEAEANAIAGEHKAAVMPQTRGERWQAAYPSVQPTTLGGFALGVFMGDCKSTAPQT